MIEKPKSLLGSLNAYAKDGCKMVNPSKAILELVIEAHKEMIGLRIKYDSQDAFRLARIFELLGHATLANSIRAFGKPKSFVVSEMFIHEQKTKGNDFILLFQLMSIKVSKVPGCQPRFIMPCWYDLSAPPVMMYMQ